MKDGTAWRRSLRGCLWITAAALLGAMLWYAPAAHAQFVKSIEQDHGTYYRLKVKLAYWGTPQDFDIVVGCNLRQTNYENALRPQLRPQLRYMGDV